VLKNEEGKFRNITKAAGTSNTHGWWNSLTAGDFDNDGDTDYVAGNLGLNSRYKASENEPVCIYAKDFDSNGSIDPVMCYYVQGENYLAHPRDQLIGQLAGMRVRFRTYREYATATFSESFLPQELEGALVVKSEVFESSYFENRGDGTFSRSSLPLLAQVSPTFGLLTGDYNTDGKLDLLMVGNSFSTEVSLGNYDAGKGMLLTGDGEGHFIEISNGRTGLFVDGDMKALATISGIDGNLNYLISNNDKELKVFQAINHEGRRTVALNDNYAAAMLKFSDGSSRKVEFYYGEGYLSQSSRWIEIPEEVVAITWKDWNNKEYNESFTDE